MASMCFHDRLYWFGAVKYNIDGLDFSANDIEHGVLRANAASPTSVGSLLGRPDWARGQFKASDPRLPLVRSLASLRIQTLQRLCRTPLALT